MKQILLYIWQLPQNLLGLLLIAFYRPERMHIMENGNRIYFATRMKGGISLGKYSIVNTCHYRIDLCDALKRDSVRHEAIGHARQSLYLGWLYLIVIGLPSIINACLCRDKGRMENVVLREFLPYAQIWDRTYVVKDVYNVKKDKSTLLVSVYGDKEITTDSIGSPYWVAAVKVSRLGEAQVVTFTIEGNDTGAERIAEIEIDTAKIKVVQAAR